MPRGRVILSKLRFRLNKLLIFVIKKLVYLKYISGDKDRTVRIVKNSLLSYLSRRSAAQYTKTMQPTITYSNRGSPNE